MSEQTPNQLSSLGFDSAEDYNKWNQLQQYSKPLVSPWLSLGLGALMGLYSQNKQEKQRKKDIKLNKTLALTKRFTGTPNKMNHPAPDMFGNVLGGVATALGTAKSINSYSAAMNLQDAVEKQRGEQRAMAALGKAREGASGPQAEFGPENQMSGIGYDQGMSQEMTWPYFNNYGPGQQQQPPPQQQQYPYNPWNNLPAEDLRYSNVAPDPRWRPR